MVVIDTALLVYQGDIPPSVASALTNVKRWRDPLLPHDCFSGRLGNLYVKGKPDELLVSGSLSRYGLGSNFYIPSPDDIRGAMWKMSSTLGVPMEWANVYRLDGAINMTLDSPPEFVTGSVASRPRYKKGVYRGGVTLSTKTRTLLLYNKVEEAQSKKAPVPPEYAGKNVLRCEVQQKRRVGPTFGGPVLGRDLFNPDFLKRFLDLYEREFGKVEFERNRHPLMAPGWRDYKLSRMLVGVETLGGVTAELDRLRAAEKAGLYRGRKSTYYKVRSNLRRITGSDRYTERSAPEVEFRSAFEKAVAEVDAVIRGAGGVSASHLQGSQS